MANWEYKVISSGKGGFASPALMEKFLNDLGQEQWEIIDFHGTPDNPLAFTGLARRPTQRDWTLEDAAAAAARAEADKLRAEFEAKFKAGKGEGSAGAAAEEAETFLAEEKLGTDDGLRRLRDTSHDDDPDAPEEENGNGAKDEWDKLAEEDELPVFFDALRPHMRRNQRGPGMSVGVDYLAKKWKLDESDIKNAIAECGLQIPADENARPVYVEYEGDLFWVNINRRGEIWINMREKPQPVFRVVQGRRVEEPEVPAGEAGGSASPDMSGPKAPSTSDARPPAAGSGSTGQATQPAAASPAPKTLLGKIRSMMRRNRRGHGWSGSFSFLTKALRTDEATLLAQLNELGLRLPAEGESKPDFAEEGDFLYWLQKNQRGEIWINARREKRGAEDREQTPEVSGQTPEAEETPVPESEAGSAACETPVSVASVPSIASPAPAEPLPPPPENTLAAVRLLLQPKKRGEGVAARVTDIAQQLGQPEERLLAALAAAGLNVPEDAKTKPTFGEHAGEIFWMNRNTRGELWLNAKAASATKRSRGRKKSEESEQGVQ
jgi:hypothetical protein